LRRDSEPWQVSAVARCGVRPGWTGSAAGRPRMAPRTGPVPETASPPSTKSLQPPEGLGDAVDAEAEEPPAGEQAPHGDARLDELDALTVAQELDQRHGPEDAPQHTAHPVVLEVGGQGVDAIHDERQGGLGDE